MKNTEIQILARLVWASNVSAWANIHREMRPAVTGLCRRGFLERINRPQSLLHDTLALTAAGTAALTSAGISIHDGRASGTAEKLVPAAKFWIDSWGQQIPA